MIPDPVPLKLLALAAALAVAAGCAHGRHHPLHRDSGPVITGNPAADPTLPPRYGRPGRLLLRCAAPADRGSAAWDVHASAQDFDEGRQSFFLKRTDQAGDETLYPLHGHFLDGGSSGIFMVHDGKGLRRGQGDGFLIDQGVNMGVFFFFRTNGEGVRAILDVLAEENGSDPRVGTKARLTEYSCRWAGEARRLSSPRAERVQMRPNSGATPPSYTGSGNPIRRCSHAGGRRRMGNIALSCWAQRSGRAIWGFSSCGCLDRTSRSGTTCICSPVRIGC